MVFADVDEAATDSGNKFAEDYFYYYLQFEPLATIAYYDAMAQMLKRLCPTKKAEQLRLLDFGCGAGEFVRRSSLAGICSEGVDYAPIARLARDLRHLPIHVSDIANSEIKNASFDVIFSHAAFEHLYDPLTIGRNLITKLKPGGLFVTTGVPNYDSVERRIFRSFDNNCPPGHVNFFNAASMRGFYQRLGLGKPTIKTYGIPIWYIVNAAKRCYSKAQSGQSGYQKFRFIPGYIPPERNPSAGHKLIAFVYSKLRIPNMGTSLLAYARKE